jgi:outer membrane protein assembly factor BamB
MKDAVPIRLHRAAGWGRPAIDAGTAFYLSREHELFAVDRFTGAERWRQLLGGVSSRTAGSRVVVHHGVVIAGDDGLFAFDGVTGAPRWRLPLRTVTSAGRYLGEAAGRLVYAGSQSGQLVAAGVRDGLVRWSSLPLGDRVTVFAPVVAAGYVVAGFSDFGTARGGGVVCLDAETGAVLWQTRFPRGRRGAAFGGGPAIVGDVVVAASTDGTLHAFDRTTGASRWTMPAGVPTVGKMWRSRESASRLPLRRPSGAASGHPSEGAIDIEDFRGMAVSGSTVFVTSLTGTLVAVRAAPRQALWRFRSPPDGSIAFGLSVHEDTAYVPFASGRTIAVDLVSGQQRWSVGAGDRRFEWPAAVAGGRVYLTSEDGLYVVEDTR